MQINTLSVNFKFAVVNHIRRYIKLMVYLSNGDHLANNLV